MTPTEIQIIKDILKELYPGIMFIQDIEVEEYDGNVELVLGDVRVDDREEMTGSHLDNGTLNNKILEKLQERGIKFSYINIIHRDTFANATSWYQITFE